MTPINFKRLSDAAKLPTYATPGAAAFDIYAPADGDLWPFAPTAMIPLGWAIELPPGHALILSTRSGHRRNYGLSAVSVGLVDSDYRGEVGMVLSTRKRFEWQAGDRIAQGMIIKAPQYYLQWSEDLNDTQRGNGGFGSTGQ